MLLLLACAGPGSKSDDSAVPADDTAGDDTGTVSDPLTLADADASVVGAAQDGAGSALTGLGDTDGDGVDDLAVAAFYGNRVCTWSGPVVGTHTMDDGVCLTGETTYDFFGYAVAGLGDLDGDGLGELAVGAVGSDDAGTEGGEVYLFKGPLSADPTASLIGEAAGDFLGGMVAGAGDLDGDGVSEWLVAATGNDAQGGGGGRAYLVSGLPTGLDGRVVDVAKIGRAHV